ncbi:hypothetical protein DPEC_G00278290 [Dallia pectoralis]|uniref:Uncharacterized protein n=1 Tax=Dallia pectoralis TaxID=75939 RepID=A0ACC2FM13_DALPE|nr:hypothetical protein DPEC_G00278290 [Dallia pectoralis]
MSVRVRERTCRGAGAGGGCIAPVPLQHTDTSRRAGVQAGWFCRCGNVVGRSTMSLTLIALLSRGSLPLGRPLFLGLRLTPHPDTQTPKRPTVTWRLISLMSLQLVRFRWKSHPAHCDADMPQ